MPLASDTFDLEAEEVRRRFRWAKRRGRPRWLWPEIAPARWREALHRIEAAVRAMLTDTSGPAGLRGDADAIGLAAYTSGMGPLLGWWIEKNELGADQAVESVLELHLRHNRIRAARMEQAAVALAAGLHGDDVEVVVLKGAHTGGAYFPEPGTRPATDIDLLVSAEDVPRAEAHLGKCGYRAMARGRYESSWRLDTVAQMPRSLRFAHADDPWAVDLHSSLDLPVSAGARVARLDRASPLSSNGRWTPFPAAKVLEQPLLLLHLALHAASGLQNLSLLRLAELHLVIRLDSAKGLLSWDAFLDMAGRTGSRAYAYPALKLCEQLTPGTVPQAVLDEIRRQVPASVARVMDKLTPATAQRVDRSSFAEHFMWTSGGLGWMRQIAADIAPSRSWRELGHIYERRLWQLVRGRFSR